MKPSCVLSDCERVARKNGGGLCARHYDEKRAGGKTCEADECDRTPVARGLCPPHHRAWKLTQDHPTCADEGCGLPILARGLCQSHYDLAKPSRQVRVEKSQQRCAAKAALKPAVQPKPLRIKPVAVPRPACAVQECGNPAHTRGWCRLHYQRWYQHGDVMWTPTIKILPLTCTVDGCVRNNHKRGLCSMHYWRLRHKGSVGSAEPIKEQGSVAAHIARQVPLMRPATCRTDWPFSRQKGRPAAWDAVAKRNVLAVHYAYRILHDHWPKQLNHICHNGECWNPYHVYEGTQRENMQDKMEAGRHGGKRGADAAGARFTCEQVREIRDTYQGRYGERVALARTHGVSISTIASIVRGDSYPDC